MRENARRNGTDVRERKCFPQTCGARNPVRSLVSDASGWAESCCWAANTASGAFRRTLRPLGRACVPPSTIVTNQLSAETPRTCRASPFVLSWGAAMVRGTPTGHGCEQRGKSDGDRLREETTRMEGASRELIAVDSALCTICRTAHTVSFPACLPALFPIPVLPQARR